ncbi:hypothetical protein IWX49DRAFT_388347 [Phyllosticta citricarpa]
MISGRVHIARTTSKPPNAAVLAKLPRPRNRNRNLGSLCSVHRLRRQHAWRKHASSANASSMRPFSWPVCLPAVTSWCLPCYGSSNSNADDDKQHFNSHVGWTWATNGEGGGHMSSHGQRGAERGGGRCPSVMVQGTNFHPLASWACKSCCVQTD